jgi:Putative transposase/Transposase zinc-binding domain
MKLKVTAADVIKRFAPSYVEEFGDKMLPSQKKALNDIVICQTEVLGGRQFVCKKCNEKFWMYHSCRNRSCPRCQSRNTKEWLDKRSAEVLNCPYVHIVVTVPSELRGLFLGNQKIMYSLFMKCVAESIIELARKKKYLGATPALLSVLHTWKIDMLYHIHVHVLVSAGGISDDGTEWLEPVNKKFFIPGKLLSARVREKFKIKLKRIAPEIFEQIDSEIWYTGWNSFLKYYGTGKKCVLKYLARYVFRIAISNSRIVSMDDTHVTIKVKNRKTGEWKLSRITGIEFIRRFVMHVLPKGFHKVRYNGLWHHSKKEQQEKAQEILSPESKPEEIKTLAECVGVEEPEKEDFFTPRCPHCGSKEFELVAVCHRWYKKPKLCA